jgi:hypothetical protein
MFAGPLGDLSALGVMNGPSHAKNAKDAKECIKKNMEHAILCLRALLAILARFA